MALTLIEGTQAWLHDRIRGNASVSWLALIVGSAPTWIAFAALVPVVAALAERWPLATRPSYRVVLLHCVASTIFPAVHIALAMLGWYVVYMHREPDLDVPRRFATILSGEYVMELLAYWLIVGLHSAWTSHRQFRAQELRAAELRTRAALLEASLSRATLSSLRAQLHPHFLFNTLNAVAVMAERRQHRRVIFIVQRLSSLLRFSLAHDADHLIALREELRFARRYLAIERVRFGKRLQVHWSVSEELLSHMVPAMVLQPLIENAIKHGVSKSAEDGEIEIGGEYAHGHLTLWVRDNGPGLVGGMSAITEGIGLRNTRDRLAQLYGDAGRLKLRSGRTGGLRATITFPSRSGERARCSEIA